MSVMTVTATIRRSDKALRALVGDVSKMDDIFFVWVDHIGGVSNPINVYVICQPGCSMVIIGNHIT